MEHKHEESRARTSAMMDGEATPAESAQWLQAWSSDGQAREDWQVYSLIGDVMRSEELATSPARDAQLLQRVREAVAREPVVLAPGALAAVDSASSANLASAQRKPRRRVWAASAAAVAGFVLVGAAYLTSRVEGDSTPWMTVSAPPTVLRSSDDLRLASVGLGANGLNEEGLSAAPWSLRSPVGGFREILRLPRGPAAQPLQSVEVLYSNGVATISVQIEPYRPQEHVPRAETGERLNALSVQRDGVWLTLMGDVPLSTLSQFAASMQPAP